MNHSIVGKYQLLQKLLMAICLLGLGQLVAQYQQDSPPLIRSWISDVQVDNYPYVTFHLDIETPGNRQFKLNEDLLLIRENDQLCHWIQLKRLKETLPTKYALILDHSDYQGEPQMRVSSTPPQSGIRTLRLLKRSMLSFISSLPTQEGVLSRDSLMLLGFGGRVDIRTEMSDQVEMYELILKNISTAGASTLYDALDEALEALGNVEGRKAIIAFVQGDDEASVVSGNQVVLAAVKAQIPLYFVDAGSSYRFMLPTLAKSTQGKLFKVGEEEQVSHFFQHRQQDVIRYEVTYLSPDTTNRDAKKWIQVKLRNQADEHFQEFPSVAMHIPNYQPTPSLSLATQSSFYDLPNWPFLILALLAFGAVTWFFLGYNP